MADKLNARERYKALKERRDQINTQYEEILETEAPTDYNTLNEEIDSISVDDLRGNDTRLTLAISMRSGEKDDGKKDPRTFILSEQITIEAPEIELDQLKLLAEIVTQLTGLEVKKEHGKKAEHGKIVLQKHHNQRGISLDEQEQHATKLMDTLENNKELIYKSIEEAKAGRLREQTPDKLEDALESDEEKEPRMFGLTNEMSPEEFENIFDDPEVRAEIAENAAAEEARQARKAAPSKQREQNQNNKPKQAARKPDAPGSENIRAEVIKESTAKRKERENGSGRAQEE